MTQQDLYTLLSSTGISTCYRSWKASGVTEIPALPWICYLFTGSENEAADNKVHQKVNNYQIELYSNEKDFDSEASIENALDGASIFYDKSETYIDTESLFEVIYSIAIT